MPSGFRRLPTVLSADEIMDKAFSRAAKISKKGNTSLDGKKKTTIAKISASGDIVTTTLDKFVNAFPRLERGEFFLTELVDVVIGLDALKHSLGSVRWCSKRVRNLTDRYLRMVRATKDMDELGKLKRQYYARVSSMLKHADPDLRVLQGARAELRKIPTVEEDVPTMVIAGYPNVGKSQLVTVMSTAAPEVAVYPFTTKGIIIGHIMDGWRKYQVIDTPGLLDRNLEDRNAIERQAVLALKYLADLIVFVLDPTETCGYPMEKQLALLESIAESFDGIPMLVIESKADMMDSGSGRMRVSAMEGIGIEELVSEVRSVLDLRYTNSEDLF